MYLELAKSCAAGVFASTPPSEQYQKRTVDLLLGTAATESHFKDRRQRAYNLQEDTGAWGLWQTEAGSVTDNILRLKRDEVLRKNCAKFLVGHDNIDGLLGTSTHCILRLIHTWDRLAILMCRLHYFKFRPEIPEGLQAQAEYYKIYYNTMLGKGSVEKYIRDWNVYVKGKYL